MSIIQDIRDKYARVAVIMIALALIGFILTDYVKGKNRGGFGGGGSNTVGTVNGKKISFDEFDNKVKQTIANMKQQGYPESPSLSQQANDQTWNQEIIQLLLNEQFGKLGMRIGKKELGDILYGPNAPEDLKKQPQFIDEATGQFNPVKAKQQIDQTLKKGTPEQKDNINTYINQLEVLRMQDKFFSLLANSINYPKWFVEKQNADNSLMAKISMVREVYSSIPDSTIKIDDKEIADYISKHKDDYKQEESRSISYVTFSAAPSKADSMDVWNKLLLLKPAFDSTKDLAQYLASEGVSNFYDGYINGKKIQIAAKDSIFKIPVGSIYGPYLDGGNYVLAKMLGVKRMPDTVKARHILIAFDKKDPKTGQVIEQRDSTTAKKLIDSIQGLIRGGANFDTLCLALSDDQGKYDQTTKKYTGGIYDNVSTGQMVAPFNDFIFGNPVGYKGVVKTEFGYHYIEVLSQKGDDLAYKVAYLQKEIVASQQTNDSAQGEAFKFAGDCHDEESFDANYEKQLKPRKIIKGIATEIPPTGAEVRGLGASRSFVRNIYAAKKGEIIKPEQIDNNYVVAVVTDIYKEGTKDAIRARPEVEPLLRNKKKGEMLKQKIGKVSTLEAAATALGDKKIETVDSLRMNAQSPILRNEPKVTGAAFNPANKGKVVPEAIEGGSGVFVIRVDSVSATAVTNGDIAEQRKGLYQQAKQNVSNPQSPSYPLTPLREAATIKDKRVDKY